MKHALAVLLATAAFGMMPQAHGRPHCSVAYENVLKKDKFANLGNCHDGGEASATVAGTIRTAEHVYTVLDFRYLTAPLRGGSRHGGQRILIIEDGRHYLGEYALSPPPLHQVSVRGQSIVIDAPEQYGNVVAFTQSGPPASAYLDGFLLAFEE